MSAGKGDSPRNLGPKFRENYDRIFGKATRCTKGTKDQARPSTQSVRTVSPHPFHPLHPCESHP